MEPQRTEPSLKEVIQLLLNEVSALKRRVEILETRNPDPAKPASEWMGRAEAAALVNRAWGTLSKWRHQPERGLIEGVHWQNDGGAVVYHREALTHWYNHRAEPAVHHDWLIAREQRLKKGEKSKGKK